MSIRVLLVDDHQLLRHGIHTALNKEQDFQVVGQAESVAEALVILQSVETDVILLDLHLRDASGPTVVSAILDHHPSVKIVILSMAGDEYSITSSVRAGVRGYITKKSSCTDLIDAMRTVAAGGTYFAREVADKLLSRIRTGNLNTEPAPEAAKGLSPRELQILRLVALGNSSKKVALMLSLSEETVRSYRKSLMKKLGVDNAARLTRFAILKGLLPAETSVSMQ